jgi:hypothetical protein
MLLSSRWLGLLDVQPPVNLLLLFVGCLSSDVSVAHDEKMYCTHTLETQGCVESSRSLLQRMSMTSQTNHFLDEGGRLTMGKDAQREETGAQLSASGQPYDAQLAMQNVDDLRMEAHLGLSIYTQSSDLQVLKSSLIINGVVLAFHLAFFCLVRLRHAKLYSNGWLSKRAPFEAGTGLCGWATASWRVSLEQVIVAAGLDAAMMLQFQQLCMKVLGVLGVPMLAIMCPLHMSYGGAQGLESDPLRMVSTSNIAEGSWLYWVHAALTWVIVVVVCNMLCNAQSSFLKIRFEWLRAMPAPRAKTCLVQNIPNDCCSDEELKSYINRKFANFGREVVDTTYVVKRIPEQISTIFTSLQEQKANLRDAEARWARTSRDRSQRPKLVTYTGEEIDSIDHYTKTVNDMSSNLGAEQDKFVEKAKDGNPDDNSSQGFVIFKQRHDAALAVKMRVPEDIMFSAPPEPMDVRYSSMLQDQSSRTNWAIIGYLLLIALILSYLPIVLFISFITRFDTLIRTFPVLNVIRENYPVLTSMWDGVVGSFALTLFISFVPTFLLLIIRPCLGLESESSCQHYLQSWYFYFQIVFVLLIVTVGNSLFNVTVRLVEDPSRIFALLADTLPQAAHFYLGFFAVQWVAHCCKICRYWSLVKYYYHARYVDSDIAYELAEPEDPDYHGIGARSARFTLHMVIALVFISVSPIISAMAWVDFFISRTIMGYLLVFAETKKADSGGLFWHTQLRHVKVGLFLYVTLMVGILCERARTHGPGILAATSFVYLIKTWIHFERQYSLVALPLEEVSALDATCEKVQTEDSYIQPELASQVAPVAMGSQSIATRSSGLND